MLSTTLDANCMNKAELATQIAETLGVSKKMGEDFVAAFEGTVTKTLVDGNEVTIAGFGTFSSKVRAGRMGVNPQNPSEKIKIPSVTVPKFKAGKALKDALKANDKEKNLGRDTSLQTDAPSPIPPGMIE